MKEQPDGTMPRSRRRTTRTGMAAALLALALVAGLAACGGDDDDETAGGGNATDTTDTTAAAGGAGGEQCADFAAAASEAGYDWSDVDGLADVDLKVGQILALTGPQAFFGTVMTQGSALAADHIRAAGGPAIDFEQGDNEGGLPDPSAAAARRLVSEEDVAVIQSSFGPATLAIIPILEQTETLAFNPAGATEDQLSQSEYLWMARPTATDAFPALADYALDTHPDAERAAILVWNEASALSSTELIADRFEELGGEVVIQEQVEIGSPDMSAQVARIRAENPDVLFLVLFGPDYATAIKEARDSGLDVPIIGSDWNTEGHTITGDQDEGYVYVSDPFDPELDSPFVQMFADCYVEEYGEAPEPFGASFYENTWVIAELAARVLADGGDPTDSTALLEALESNPTAPMSIVCTQLEWDLETHAMTGKPQALYEVTDGSPERIGLIEGDELDLGAELSC